MPEIRNPRAKELAGTNLRDTLDAIANGDILHGLGGRDLLRSTFDRTSLFGDDGNDRLVTKLALHDEVQERSPIVRQAGGVGNDTLTASIVGSNYGAVESEIFLDGGAGNDRIFAINEVGSGENGLATSTVDGGDGNDVIDVKTSARGFTDTSTNNVLGGLGDDKITASATGGDWAVDSYATNNVDGGEGDDVIDVIARVRSNGGYIARNHVLGGSGDDVITAGAWAGSNDSIGVAQSVVIGGGGDDVLEMSSGAGGNGDSTVTTDATGGSGDDDITSEVEINAMYNAKAVIRIDGELGDDRVESTITMYGYDPTYSSRIVNRIDGDGGNDELIARLLDMPGSDEDPISAINKLDGAEGNDLLTAEIIGQGRSIFYGGAGRDELRVHGGSNNLLSGEGGDDRLFLGSGSDSLIGGAGIDDFIFDITTHQGSDKLLDFDGSLDRLCFIGITDNGVAGIADDLDAISSFTHEGLGGDLIATFDSGSEIRFVGCDLGNDPYRGQPLIGSFADLVDSAMTQLVIEPL